MRLKNEKFHFTFWLHLNSKVEEREWERNKTQNQISRVGKLFVSL